MNKSNQALPTIYAKLIIFSLLPQLLSGNPVLSMLSKIVIFLHFVLQITTVSKYKLLKKDFLYLVVFLINVLVPFFVDGGNLYDNLQYIFVFITTFLILHVAPKYAIEETEESINKFFQIFSYFVVFSCLYNIIINSSQLTNFTSLTIYSKNEVKSFFDNKNTFGFFLMYGIFSSAILRVRTKKNIWLLFMGIMIVNLFMSMCRTSIVVSVLVILLIFLGENSSLLKKIAVIVLVFAVYKLASELPELKIFITQNVFGNTDSMEKRFDFVRIIYPSITGLYRIFGYGITNAVDISIHYTNLAYYHNTFIQFFVEGGYIKLFILIFWIFSSFINSLRIKRHNKQDGNICIIAILMYIVYSFGESVPLFSSTVMSMTATIFVVALPTYLLCIRKGD